MGDTGQVTWVIFWHWWALAAVLLVFEMMLPGVVFLFLAVGAAAAGLFLMVVPGLGLELQLFVFAIVSVLSAVVLRPTLKRLQRSRAHYRDCRSATARPPAQ